MSEASRIEEQAATFRARQEEAHWTDQDQSRLDAWLEESTAHRVAWLRMDYGWRRLDRLASLRSPSAEMPVRARPAPLRFPLAMAASLLLVCALGLLAFQVFGAGRGTYVTEVGERETVPLADGTRVELNTNTRLRASIDEEQRTVWLDRGEAYFDVAHDPGRPFVVHAADQRVTVLGTRFSVRRDNGRVVVAVAEGKVRVAPDQAAKAKPAVVTKGDLVVAARGATLIAPKSIARVENQLAWRRGLLVFDKATLADVVAELNRYNERKLVVQDEEAASIQITGSFDASNIDAFARVLHDAFGLRIENDRREVRISS